MRNRTFTKNILLVFGIICIVILVALASVNRVNGKSDRVKTVKSVCILEGDSLWSIAENFYTEECGDFRDYVSEIRKTNNLKDDNLFAGNYILVPYYR